MKPPKNSKLVFKGKIFEIYHWPQKMFDGSFETFEVLKRQDTVIIIAACGNKIVTIKQKQPGTDWYYGEPSGRMDKDGESPKAAALRELLEETGMKPKKIFLWKKVNPSRKILRTIHIFVAQNCKKVSEQKLDSGEKIIIEQFSFDDWLKLSDRSDYIEGATIVDMLKARLHPEYKMKLKKMIFGS